MEIYISLFNPYKVVVMERYISLFNSFKVVVMEIYISLFNSFKVVVFSTKDPHLKVMWNFCTIDPYFLLFQILLGAILLPTQIY